MSAPRRQRPPAQEAQVTPAERRLLAELRRRGVLPDAAETPLASFASWAQWLPTATGKLLDFDRYPYQRDLYEVLGDMSVKEAVVMKAVQVGASELLARLMLFLAVSRSITALYVFPAARQMNDFRDGRIRPLIENDPRLQASIGSTMNKGLIEIGGSQCYYRGSSTIRDLISLPADALFLDEYDMLDHRHVPEAERRVAASELALIRRVGVPTDPDFGIAEQYERTDQRRWHVTCGSCDHPQPLTFEDNVTWDDDPDGDVINARRVCRRCQADLDVSCGRWIAAYPQRRIPGFHVSRLIVPGQNIEELVAASRQTDPHRRRTFQTADLGLPYHESEERLSRRTIAEAVEAGRRYNGGEPFRMEPFYNGGNVVTAGIDVASSRDLHVRVSEHLDWPGDVGPRKRALYIGVVPDFTELLRLLERYSVDFACIDAAPEGRLARALAAQAPMSVMPVFYRDLHEPFGFASDLSSVTVDRTTLIDAMIAALREQRNFLPVDPPPEYVEQMIAPRRTISRSETGRKTPRYRTPVGRDDYFHAETFDTVAEMLFPTFAAEAGRGEWELAPIDEVVDFERSPLRTGRLFIL